MKEQIVSSVNSEEECAEGERGSRGTGEFEGGGVRWTFFLGSSRQACVESGHSSVAENGGCVQPRTRVFFLVARR
jgi:hypothetical protein